MSCGPRSSATSTNGVTPRRFLVLCNPNLSSLISQKIGEDWIRDLTQLRQLEASADDAGFREEWRRIKKANKERLASEIQERTGTTVDPDSLFDIQVKRIHEYKRQHLNVLHVVTLYNRLRQNPALDLPPRTVLFGGKAAPGYFMAKLIIKLIHAVADVVNNDPKTRDRLKVVFLPDFNVKHSQRVFPAGELSEQISMAGKEASGTGNMKFALNGALTIGTLDGANIEIREEVGAENFFLFGLSAAEVSERKRQGYRPRQIYEGNPELCEALDLIGRGYFSPDEPGLFEPIVSSLLDRNEYLLLADYASYVERQDEASQAYRDRDAWTRKSILNVARIGKFSSDRAIREYCEDIWRVEPRSIESAEG